MGGRGGARGGGGGGGGGKKPEAEYEKPGGPLRPEVAADLDRAKGLKRSIADDQASMRARSSWDPARQDLNTRIKRQQSQLSSLRNKLSQRGIDV